MQKRLLAALLVTGLIYVGCGEDDPVVTPANNTSTNNTSTNNTSTNNTSTNNTSTNNTSTNNNVPECVDDPSLYTPGADDTWPACVADNGLYSPFEASISTAARVAAFETIADLLWRNGTPGSEDFAEAYEQFSLGEGLLSRVARREDEHYPPVMDAQQNILSCRDEGVPAMDPDRCVGPAQMVPIFNEAFEAGLAGTDPLIQAAKIEATLLWFLYLSTYKEAVTCANVLKDCDSSYAYYTGDFPRDGGIGLAGYYRELLPEAHDATFDGILAVRCWRDLDAAIPAENTDLKDRALAQLDRGLLQGFGAIVLDRLDVWESASGAQRAADWEALKILGMALVREAEVRDPALGAAIRTEFSKTSDASFDVDSARSAITTLFTCL